MVLLSASVVASAAIPALLSGPPSGGEATTARVRVEPGESLWEIATGLTAPGCSPATTVREIMRLNDLDTPEVAAGAVLTVPREAHPDVASR